MKKCCGWLSKYWLLILTIAIGVFLRFYKLRELTTFGGDQGVDYLRVWQMISERRLSLLGPVTHVGIYLGPLYYYLLIPFFILFNFDPIAAPVMFAMFGTATVGLVYILARALLRSDLSQRGQTFADLFAFLTALLYAVSPVIIESSRAPSQPHLIPFFAALLLISIFNVANKKEKWWDGLIIGISLAGVIQFHYFAFPLWILTGIIVVIRMSNDLNHWTKGFWRSLVLSMSILLAPIGLFEMRHQFFMTSQILDYLGKGEVSFSVMNWLERFLDLTWFSFDRLIGQNFQLVTTFTMVMALAGVFWLFLFDNKKHWYAGILFMGWLLTIGIVSLYFDPKSNHYISVAYPTIILLVTWGLYKTLPVKLAILVMAILIGFNLSKYNPWRDNGYTMPTGVTTKTIEQAARMIADDVALTNATFNIVNTLDGDTRANPYRYALTAQYAKSPLDVEKYTEADYLYIVSNLSQNELLNDKRWELASFPVMEVTELGMIDNKIKIFKWRNGTANRKDLIK